MPITPSAIAYETMTADMLAWAPIAVHLERGRGRRRSARLRFLNGLKQPRLAKAGDGRRSETKS